MIHYHWACTKKYCDKLMVTRTRDITSQVKIGERIYMHVGNPLCPDCSVKHGEPVQMVFVKKHETQKE